MARIAVGGFLHETNTFASINATFADLERHDVWPDLTRGATLLDAVAGLDIGLQINVDELTEYSTRPR